MKLTEQQRWLLNQIGDDPDKFVSVRVRMTPALGHEVGIVEARPGENIIRPIRSTYKRVTLQNIYGTVLALIQRGQLASVGFGDSRSCEFGELYGRGYVSLADTIESYRSLTESTPDVAAGS